MQEVTAGKNILDRGTAQRREPTQLTINTAGRGSQGGGDPERERWAGVQWVLDVH